MSSGGATFAQTMEECRFGALFPGTGDRPSKPMNVQKCEDLYAAMEIYREAIQRLAQRKNLETKFLNFRVRTNLY